MRQEFVMEVVVPVRWLSKACKEIIPRNFFSILKISNLGERLPLQILTMDRRNFLRNTAVFAVAVSTTGFIRFEKGRYIGDCDTTSDILGPFYRPGAPMRTNFLQENETGQVVILSGVVKHEDCKTFLNNVTIELWHCNPDGVYDNDSDKFRYRGKIITDGNGKYSFKTILPVPYPGSDGKMRPAHFHFMISAENYPNLITQIYFTGDKYIPEDRMASSKSAEKRILKVQDGKDGEKTVSFDITMSKKSLADPVAIDKLTGVYINLSDSKNQLEVFRKDNLLWVKNEVFGFAYEYLGSNVFIYPGINDVTLKFDLKANGTVLLTRTASRRGSEPQVTQWRRKD